MARKFDPKISNRVINKVSTELLHIKNRMILLYCIIVSTFPPNITSISVILVSKYMYILHL